MITGSCNCGQVAFEVRADPKDIYFCHCSICRRYTGVNGIAVIVVANADFHWQGGEDNITHWSKPDADWDAHFCKTCGSPVPGPNDPERMFIPAGLIREGGEELAVAHHIWTASKASWDEITDSGKQHPEAFQS